jgi:hypothetical protein
MCQAERKDLIGSDRVVSFISVDHIIKTLRLLVPEKRVKGLSRLGCHAAVSFRAVGIASMF